jgi:hypothetical protein
MGSTLRDSHNRHLIRDNACLAHSLLLQHGISPDERQANRNLLAIWPSVLRECRPVHSSEHNNTK